MNSKNQQQKLSFSAKFARLTRAQFLPLILIPLFLGTSIAFFERHVFILLYFLIALLGSVCLHLAANAIDDVYDYQSGVDTISEKTFPKTLAVGKSYPAT